MSNNLEPIGGGQGVMTDRIYQGLPKPMTPAELDALRPQSRPVPVATSEPLSAQQLGYLAGIPQAAAEMICAEFARLEARIAALEHRAAYLERANARIEPLEKKRK